MGSNSEIEGLAAHRYLRGARAALVATHQPGIADHIGRNDCCNSALLTGQRNFPASPPRIVEGLNRPGNDRIGANSTRSRPPREMAQLRRYRSLHPRHVKARYRLGKATFATTDGNGREAGCGERFDPPCHVDWDSPNSAD